MAFISPLKNIPSRTYKILEKSTFEIKGVTNVNTFNCLCNENIEPQTFNIERTKNRYKYNFKNTSLKIKINSFDCGNKLMNKDLQKSLHADKYPHIEIHLLEITEEDCNPLHELKDWVKIKALTEITLNGVTQKQELNITAKKYADNRFRFIGIKPIRMSDFCVEPPTAMMGMIKVQDEIKIALDLEVVIE